MGCWRTTTPHSVKAALRAAWEDIPHSARLYAVRPNPDDGPSAHIIIEFEASLHHDALAIPVLRRIFRNGQAQSEASYHYATRHAYDLYHQAGLFSTCAPWATQECRLYLNRIQLRETLPFALRPGSLLDIHVDPLLQQRPIDVKDQFEEEDEIGFMQRPTPSQSDGPITHDFFHLENEHFQIDIAQADTQDINTIVENDRHLPTEGPSSIRAFHWVANPPRIGQGHNVYILELREDAESRLMNDDVLCLCQLIIEQPGSSGDASTRIRVLWTPHIASSERIMFHLRALDLCREKTCLLSVNHIVWHEHDSILRHFRDGDFIQLRVRVEPDGSVERTRCDFQSYEATERQRRVFTNDTDSHTDSNNTDHLYSPSTTSIRSRSRRRSQSEPEAESDPEAQHPLATSDEEEHEPDGDEEDQPSLIQIARRSHHPTSRTAHECCTMDFAMQLSTQHDEEITSEKPSPLRHHLVLSELLPKTSVISCDMTEVHQAKQLLQHLPWLMSDIDKVALPSTVLDAITPALLPWNFETPVQYQLYTDGSFYKKNPEVGGCGIVLVVHTESGPLCGGLMTRTCLPTARSHSAEAVAMLWATIAATQLHDLHRCYFPDVPFNLEFCYDAEVTGKQSAGQWTSLRHPDIQRLTRNMIYILQQRVGQMALQWTHIPAHQGHWWNEVADTLAKHAARYPEVVQNSDLLYTILDAPNLMEAFDWVWAYEAMDGNHPSMPHIFDHHLYHFRTSTGAKTNFACHFGSDGLRSDHPSPTTGTLTLKVATFNVLTLASKGDQKLGTGSTGRHLSLLQQCHEAGLHIVGVQETRTKRITCKANPWYNIIHAPCRSDGHYGIQIWLHHSLPFCPTARPFNDDDYRIIWSTYNVLAIRLLHPALRCIVISARAPTSDKSMMELQAFWSEITTHVLQKFPGWKVILLCDSNAHVGSCPSTSISTYGEETENQAGTIFHGWLLANDIWLPSTWPHVHHGDHYTYMTPSGTHCHRLDFVGLSMNWPLDSVATAVDFDIDGSLSRFDHFAATCTFVSTTTINDKSSDGQRRKPSMDRTAIAKLLHADPHYFASLPDVPWSMDIHRHATGLATATLGHLQTTIPDTRRQVRKRQLEHPHLETETTQAPS